jgi:hypothetical protein
MKQTEIYHRHALHTEALYLNAVHWLASADPNHLPPSPIDLNGIKRLRVILPESASPPRGWQLLRKTVVRTVPVLTSLKTLPFARSADSIVLSPAHPEWQNWIKLHWDCYDKTHQDNPPRKTTFAEREALFAGPDLHENNAFGLLHNRQLVGFSSLRRGPLPSGAAEFGWTGIAPNAPSNTYQTLIATVIANSAILGFETIDFEADSTDQAAWSLLTILPSEVDTYFATWQLNL